MAKNQSRAEDLRILRIALEEDIMIDVKYLYDEECSELYWEYLQLLNAASEIKSKILGLSESED